MAAEDHVKIQLRRTNLDISDDNNKNAVNAVKLGFGEPLLLNNEGYLVVGNEDTQSGTTLNTDLLKFKPFSDDIVEKQVFFADSTGGTPVAKYMADENGNTLYTKTRAEDVSFGESTVQSQIETLNGKTATLVANGKYAASNTAGGSAISADKATKLTNARTISISGAVTGSVNFDGTANVNINTAINHTHSYAGSSSVGGAANTLKVTDIASDTDNVYVLGTKASGGQTVYRAYSPAGTYGAGVYFKGSTGVLYGAAWNDFAEYRKCEGTPGDVVVENGDGTLSVASERMQKGASVISDTFGMVIGKNEEGYQPLAVAGRVLVKAVGKCDLKPGDAVCTFPGGAVCKMSRWEIITHPDCIVGYVSEIPDYALWNDKVYVDGRIWIKVK